MRGRGWRRCVAVIGTALACAALAAPGLAGAAGKAPVPAGKFPFPDKSLNGTGLAELGSVVNSPAFARRFYSLAPAPSGALWLATSAWNCGAGDCLSSWLSRVGSNGGLVTTIGEAGSLGYTSDARSVSGIGVDAEGRAVTVTPEAAGEITVRRFLASGALDPSFGSGGLTRVDCACLAETAEALRVSFDNDGRILIGIPIYGGYPRVGYVSVVRLLANGSLDPSFGTEGIVRSTASNFGQFVSPGGAVFLADAEEKFGRHVIIERYTNGGVADTAYEAKANAVLARAQVERPGEPQFFWVVGMRFREHGIVDVILGASISGASVVRLRSNGAAETKFGKNGVRYLNRKITQVVPAGNGETLALTGSVPGFGGTDLTRFLPNYKLESRFGDGGSFPISELYEDQGVTLATTTKGRVSIVDNGLRTCRSGNCPPEPSVRRYRVGPAK